MQSSITAIACKRHVQSSIGFEQRPSRSLKHAPILLDHPPWQQIEHECRIMRPARRFIFDEKLPNCQICLASAFGQIIELFRAQGLKRRMNKTGKYISQTAQKKCNHYPWPWEKRIKKEGEICARRKQIIWETLSS